MKGLMSLITEKAPTVVKSVTHILENHKARSMVEATSPHPDLLIVRMLAFQKKEHFKDLAEAMAVAKKNGFSAKEIATAAGCSVATVYKAIRNATKE